MNNHVTFALQYQLKIKAITNMFNYFILLISFIIFVQKINSQNVPGACICVPTGTCNGIPGGGTPGTGSDGTGQIVSKQILIIYSLFLLSDTC